ncbi:hypothetical protein X801_08708, partial [Opisthorchis viverrini]
GRTKRYGEIICHPDFSDSRLLVYNRSHVRSPHAESQSSGSGSARQPSVQSTKETTREPNELESLEIASKPIALKLYFESGKTTILRFDNREVRDQCLNVLQYVVQANKLRNGYPDFEHVWCVMPKIYAKDPFATSLLTKFSRGRHYFCLTDSEALLCRQNLRVPVLMVPGVKFQFYDIRTSLIMDPFRRDPFPTPGFSHHYDPKTSAVLAELRESLAELDEEDGDLHRKRQFTRQ